MAKVKIGDKEYKLDSLTSLDLKKLEAKKKEEKIEDYDYAYTIILFAIKKFNKDVDLTLDQFMESFPLKDLDKKFDEIGDTIGLDFEIRIGKFQNGKIQ